MFRARQADREDRQRVFEALRQVQETVDSTKQVMDAPAFPDAALITGCDPKVGLQLAEFYAVLTRTHSQLTEIVFGYTPDECPHVGIPGQLTEAVYSCEPIDGPY